MYVCMYWVCIYELEFYVYVIAFSCGHRERRRFAVPIRWIFSHHCEPIYLRWVLVDHVIIPAESDSVITHAHHLFSFSFFFAQPTGSRSVTWDFWPALWFSDRASCYVLAQSIVCDLHVTYVEIGDARGDEVCSCLLYICIVRCDGHASSCASDRCSGHDARTKQWLNEKLQISTCWWYYYWRCWIDRVGVTRRWLVESCDLSARVFCTLRILLCFRRGGVVSQPHSTKRRHNLHKYAVCTSTSTT